MFTVETVEKFAKIVNFNVQRQLTNHTDVPLVMIFWMVNHHVDIYRWMNNLPAGQRELFSRMLYELGYSYKDYLLLKEILDLANVLNVIKYCTIGQIKEKYDTMRIYVNRTEEYINAVDDEDFETIAKRVQIFDFLIDEIENRFTRDITFNKTIYYLARKQKYAYNDKTSVSIDAVKNSIFGPYCIMPRIGDFLMDDLDDLISKIEYENLQPTDEQIASITEAIHKVMPR